MWIIGFKDSNIVIVTMKRQAILDISKYRSPICHIKKKDVPDISSMANYDDDLCHIMVISTIYLLNQMIFGHRKNTTIDRRSCGP